MMRLAAVLLIAVVSLSACGSSSQSTPTSQPVDVDVQAAQACKAMDALLEHTSGGQLVTAADATAVTTRAGALLRDENGVVPVTGDPPKWKALGTELVQLMVAINNNGDKSSIRDLTAQVHQDCASIPGEAQRQAKYTPTTS